MLKYDNMNIDRYKTSQEINCRLLDIGSGTTFIYTYVGTYDVIVYVYHF